MEKGDKGVKEEKEGGGRGQMQGLKWEGGVNFKEDGGVRLGGRGRKGLREEKQLLVEFNFLLSISRSLQQHSLLNLSYMIECFNQYPSPIPRYLYTASWSNYLILLSSFSTISSVVILIQWNLASAHLSSPNFILKSL